MSESEAPTTPQLNLAINPPNLYVHAIRDIPDFRYLEYAITHNLKFHEHSSWQTNRSPEKLLDVLSNPEQVFIDTESATSFFVYEDIALSVYHAGNGTIEIGRAHV